MRMLIGAVVATALLSAASAAYAANATGKIASLNMTKDTITLDNGATYMAPKSVSLAKLKLGEKIMVSYAQSGHTMTITSIKPMA